MLPAASGSVDANFGGGDIVRNRLLLSIISKDEIHKLVTRKE